MHLIGFTDAGDYISAPAYHSDSFIPSSTLLKGDAHTIRTSQDLPAGTHFVCDEDIPERLESLLIFDKEPDRD